MRKADCAAVLFAALAGLLASSSQGAWTKYPRPIPVERDQPGMAFDKVRSEIVLFGGNNANAPQKRNDTWVWNGTAWAEKHPLNKPSERFLVAMAFDEARGVIVLFGGFDPFGPKGGQLGDTWTWDGTNWTQQTPPASPPARYGAGMAYDPTTQRVLLFGGSGDAGEVNDTWSWDGTTWTELHPANAPPARLYPAMSSHPVRNSVLLFGGFNFFMGGSLNDIWTWNGSNWTQQLPLTSPPGRSFAGMAPDPTGNLVLFGGANSFQNIGDTWSWDGDNWSARTSVSNPAARAGFGFAYDADRNRVVLFGGRSGAALSTEYRDDTWTWDGTQWLEVALPNPPPERSEAGMVYDSAREEVVLFGGWNGQRSLEDTWIWKDGWSKREPVPAPAERSLHGMAFDEERDETIAFGGFSNGARLSDTWSWNGTGWTLRTPLTSPSPRYGFGMVYDAARKKIVLFGGSATGSFQNDTWSWDGITWTQHNPPVAPPIRYWPSMGFHAASGKVLLFGGFDPDFAVRDDTWTWDGTTWTEEQPSDKPAACYGAALGDSRGSNRLVLFGGSDGGGSLTSDFQDTWTWDGTNWTKEQPAAFPSRALAPALIYETPRKRFLYFGGSNLEEGFLRETWAWSFAPQLARIGSSKVHGLDQRWEVDLPFLGPAGIECRSAGPNSSHQLVFTFANPLTGIGQASLTSGSGSVRQTARGTDPRQCIVDLSGVTDGQRILVSLPGLSDGATSGEIVVPVVILAGDTNADGRVNVGDTNQTKANSGSLTNSDNFRTDVNLDGRINVGDTNFVKAHSGSPEARRAQRTR